ncbi:hypothetical protein H8959_009820 [Pygathrix nigripes]
MLMNAEEQGAGTLLTPYKGCVDGQGSMGTFSHSGRSCAPACKCLKEELSVALSAVGRKSRKAKEKKQKWLGEPTAMDAVCAKGDAVNRLGDPLKAFLLFRKSD